ncbi:YnfU family zinc-binding protein [Klebsiella oxytoca]|uniref:YnfU family zinc-binding protein n=1 Tax=Klebsiella oxytoca TaxID=571 RepID=UPI001C0F26CD|nr:YnfU family zinc-binding protein [Klebsiella oxytoca]WDQ08226.1 YnfU family zinc-binding protein [Klebsiella oxytoca]
MSERKDAKTRRNYLVKCSCPNCSQDSEHSFSRVQKGAQLIRPYCHKFFQSSAKTAA